MAIKRLNPDTLHKNPAFTQVATVDSSSKLVFVGGQNGVTKDGKLAGKDIARGNDAFSGGSTGTGTAHADVGFDTALWRTL